MKICPQCNNKVKSSAIFCPKCGYAFDMSLHPDNGHKSSKSTSLDTKLNQVNKSVSKRHGLLKLIIVIAIILIGFGGVHYYHNDTTYGVNMEKLLPEGNWTLHYRNQVWNHAYFHSNSSSTNNGNSVNGCIIHAINPHTLKVTSNTNNLPNYIFYFHLQSNKNGILHFKLAHYTRGPGNFTVHGNKTNDQFNPIVADQYLYLTLHKD